MRSPVVSSHRRSHLNFFNLLVLGLSLFSVAIPGQSQTTDPVHVAPASPPGAAVAMPPVAASGEDLPLHAHAKPLRVDVDLVQVPVTVLDEMNRPVMGLQKEDFSVFEDENAQQIRSFATEDAPISIGLLLDFSKSMSNKFHNEREAVQEFFQNANANDDYFAISFSNRPQLLADATQSIGEIQAKLTTVTPNGYTALFDAIYLGVSKMRTARYKRRALLVITDGCDTTSRYTAKETKRMAREADVEIYAIALNNPIPLVKTLEEKLGQRDLSQITEATGGRTIMIDNAAQIPAAAAAISWELRNEYVLGYRPSNVTRDGKWRKVKVRVSTSRHNTPLQAYYRRGYSAPAE